MLAIYKREMKAYFISPLGYVFLGVYLLVSGFVEFDLLAWPAYFAYISLALGFKNIRRMLNAKCPEDIADLDGDTAKLVMIFSLILAIANFVSPFVVR